MIENILSFNFADAAQKTGGVKPTERSSNINAKETEKTTENRDKYVPSEEKEPIGLYSAAPYENEEPPISFEKAESKFNDNGDEPEKEAVTANTDKVDREIKKLRDKAQMLSQRLRSADESTAADIRRELEQVKAELAQKDNDEYRRQNAVFT